jgi:hypothetical protein
MSILLPYQQTRAVLVILNITDYTGKVMALLEDPVYKKLAEDPTQSMVPEIRLKIPAQFDTLYFVNDPFCCDTYKEFGNSYLF